MCFKGFPCTNDCILLFPSAIGSTKKKKMIVVGDWHRIYSLHCRNVDAFLNMCTLIWECLIGWLVLMLMCHFCSVCVNKLKSHIFKQCGILENCSFCLWVQIQSDKSTSCLRSRCLLLLVVRGKCPAAWLSIVQAMLSSGTLNRLPGWPKD